MLIIQRTLGSCQSSFGVRRMGFFCCFGWFGICPFLRRWLGCWVVGGGFGFLFFCGLRGLDGVCYFFKFKT